MCYGMTIKFPLVLLFFLNSFEFLDVICVCLQFQSFKLSLILGYSRSPLLFHWSLCHDMWLQGKKAMMKFKNSTDSSQRMNPYQLPNISNYLMPIPPPPPPLNGKIRKENRSESWRRRRFRPTTAPNGLEPLFTRVIMELHVLIVVSQIKWSC